MKTRAAFATSPDEVTQMNNEDQPALRTIEIAGPPRSMGECFGEEFADQIRQFAGFRMDRLAEFVHKHDPERGLSREDVLALAGQTVEAHGQFSPAIWAEFCGIARGAGLSVEELLIGNGFTDFRDFVLFDSEALRGGPVEPPGECTAFLVPAECADGAPIVGQTWDMDAEAREFLVLVHRKPDDAPETLGLTTVGCLCLIGLNSEGVAVGNTNLMPVDCGVGVNYLFTITEALGCASAAEAADAVESARRLSGHDFYMADERTAVNVETTARRSYRTAVRGEAFVHANHYLADDLKPLEFPGADLSNSQWRHERLASDLGGLPVPITMENCWERLSGITQGEGGACPGGSAAVATCAAVVMCPGTRTLYVCAGGPTADNREVLTL